MKKLILFFLILITIYSCGDKIAMRESDLIKYPWLNSFLEIEIKDFEGTHNIDTGRMQFSYRVSEKSNDNILAKMDNIAKNENWSLISSSNTDRKYSKYLKQYQADTKQTIVTIEINKIKHRILFDIE